MVTDFRLSVLIPLYINDSSYYLKTEWESKLRVYYYCLDFKLCIRCWCKPFLACSPKIHPLLWPPITHTAALTILFSTAVEILLCTAVKPHWTGQACTPFISLWVNRGWDRRWVQQKAEIMDCFAPKEECGIEITIVGSQRVKTWSKAKQSISSSNE